MKANVIVALVVGLVLGFFGGKLVAGPDSGSNAAAPSAPSAPSAAAPTPRPAGANDQTVFKVPIDGNPVKGSADALVTIVEVSDYQCPFCARAEVTIRQLQEQYGEKLRVVMKQNPLSFHPRAKPAAIAALAAGEQGKYWEYHAKLFSKAPAIAGLNDSDLEGYAKELGLDMAKWKASLNDPKHAALIQKDQALAASLGATGTPAFFINGRKISGAQPIGNFQRVIDEELAKAEKLVKSGTKASEVYGKVIAAGVTSPPAAPAQRPAAPAGPKKIAVPADSPFYGPKAAKVTIVAWSDFECPFCGRVNPTIEQIKKEYGKDVKIVFRHQPLSFHKNAQLAAEASMAAHEQGKFWEYHDKLFANQRALDRASLEKYAQELSLDMGKFKSALDSGKYRAKVQADSAQGTAVGANGTPTFFINGRELVGAQPFPAFKTIIDEEITKADKLIASGTKLEDVYEKLLAQAPAPAAPGAPAAPAAVQDIEIGKAPVAGAKSAPVKIVVWSDFECPFCSRAVPTVEELLKDYEGKVQVAFKHQPLPFHKNAKLAAAASMAANEQGKFWQYHDKLFANQRALDRASLEKYAQELNLDMGKFKSALDSGKYNAIIEADAAEGMKVGANGTPTFFINGRKLVGAQPAAAFKTIIDEELKKAGK